MTARQWLQAHPEALDWARQTYQDFPGRQKHGVWKAIFQGLQTRGYPGTLNAVRIVMTDSDLVPQDSAHQLSSPSAPEPTPTNTLHVKKLHVHVPPSVTPASSNGMLTAVLYGDTHYPFQDDSALRVVAQVIRVAQPDVV